MFIFAYTYLANYFLYYKRQIIPQKAGIQDEG